MSIRFFLGFFWVFGVVSAGAQQLPQYSLWQINPYAYNPACAGLEHTLVANAVYRQQWIDLDGAPVTQQVNAHLPLHVIRSGVGLKVENDLIGPHRTTQALVSYNYQMDLGRQGLLSVGLGAGYQQYVLDGSRLRAPRGDYNQGVFQHNDPFLPLGRITAGAPVVEMGAYLIVNKLEVGVAAQPVFAPTLQQRSNGAFRLSPRRHYLATASYQIQVSDHLLVKPGLLVKSDVAETQTEVSAIARWKENITAGVGYRGFGRINRDALVLLAGTQLSDKTTLYYAFDLPLSALKATNRGSHEVMLRYFLNRPLGEGRLPPVIYNPRFF
jgi:type IX secretion system PorP/SprF family membrane protein